MRVKAYVRTPLQDAIRNAQDYVETTEFDIALFEARMVDVYTEMSTLMWFLRNGVAVIGSDMA